jgi:hypothetical protein
MKPFKILNKIKNEQLDDFDFKKDAQNVRNTKKWDQNRDEYLADKERCEWCEKETNKFDVHHTWGQSFSRQWMKATDDAFVDSKQYNSNLTNNRKECPNCSMKDYYKRKTKKPTYRCNNCKTEFNTPEEVEGGVAIKSDKYGNKQYTTDEYYNEKAKWVKSNRDKVKSKFKQRYDKLMDEYASLREDQVVAICNKCHYKEEKTRKRRCPNCEKNWYDPKKMNDNMCWDCIVDKKGLEKCPECDNKWYQPTQYERCKSCRE